MYPKRDETYPQHLANFLRKERGDVMVIREETVEESNSQRLVAVINNVVRTYEIDRLTGDVTDLTDDSIYS